MSLEELKRKIKQEFSKYCSSRDYCVGFDKESPECQKEQGCFSPENVKAYLEWCRRVIENEFG